MGHTLRQLALREQSIFRAGRQYSVPEWRWQGHREQAADAVSVAPSSPRLATRGGRYGAIVAACARASPVPWAFCGPANCSGGCAEQFATWHSMCSGPLWHRLPMLAVTSLQCDDPVKVTYGNPAD